MPTPSHARLDDVAFGQRYQEAYRTLWCVAAAVLGSRSGADDVVQDAAVTALGQLDRFDPGTDFVAWMAQIVRYTALNRARRESRRRAAPIGDDVAGARPDGSAGWAGVGVARAQAVRSDGSIDPAQDAFDDAMVRALGGIDETARACLLLKSVLGLPYQRIALTLGIPEGTAMSHVHRARRRLREALRSAGFTHTPAPGGAR